MESLAEYIKKYFCYHPDGTITRTDRKGGLGSYDRDGYKIIKIKGKQIKAHRLVWFLCYGHFPTGEIDHINRIRDDNRIENLRIATRQAQADNTSKKINPDTGAIGIYLDKSTKGLLARYSFHHKGKTYRFRTLAEAINKRSELWKN